MTELLYSLRGLVRRFGDREVLHIDSLDLEQGRIYGLLGPNGSGKTVLLRLLSFMDAPTAGEIYFFGDRVYSKQAASLRSRVVWVPQTPVMFTGSLQYNVEYPMRIKGVGRDERREKAFALLRKVGLEHLANASARRLSGGEAQRGSVARALAAGAEVILFDEPTASVDYRSRGELISLIKKLRYEHGMSLIVTSHDQFLVDNLCEDVVTLFDGRVSRDGKQTE